MVYYRSLQRVLVCTLFFLAFSSVSSAHKGSGLILSQYPVPGAEQVVCATDIGLRACGAFERASIEGDQFVIRGSRSGLHSITPFICRDGRTLILHPAIPFDYTETVTVRYTARLQGGLIASDSFSFTTKSFKASHSVPFDAELSESISTKQHSSSILSADSLPKINITVDRGACPGDIYISTLGFKALPNANYLLVLDEHGAVKKQLKISPHNSSDFKRQDNGGLLTYYDFTGGKYYGRDSSMQLVDSFQVAPGYLGDLHELKIFPDGGFALISSEVVDVDMSAYLASGNNDAVVTSNCIQIFDKDRHMLMNWRGLDHYQITDAKYEKLDAAKIDYQHANSLDFDSLGNIIISNRHLSEVTKINGETGDIMWRLGGAHNQFRLVQDSIWFSYQHAARFLPNGHITLLDNSNFDTVIGKSNVINQTRALEYALDTNLMTATLVWQYHHSPETYSSFMGNAQRLPNGNTLIGWGGDDSISATEVDAQNNTVFEFQLGAGNYSYRAIKVPRDTTLNIPQSEVQTPPDQKSFSVDLAANRTVILRYAVSNAADAYRVLDVLGREVLSLPSGMGEHQIVISSRELKSGTYFIALAPNGQSVAKFQIE